MNKRSCSTVVLILRFFFFFSCSIEWQTMYRYIHRTVSDENETFLPFFFFSFCHFFTSRSSSTDLLSYFIVRHRCNNNFSLSLYRSLYFLSWSFFSFLVSLTVLLFFLSLSVSVCSLSWIHPSRRLHICVASCSLTYFFSFFVKSCSLSLSLSLSRRVCLRICLNSILLQNHSER